MNELELVEELENTRKYPLSWKDEDALLWRGIIYLFLRAIDYSIIEPEINWHLRRTMLWK